MDLIERADQAVILTAGGSTSDVDARFERLCELYPDARIEVDGAGNIIMVSGNSEDSGFRSGRAFFQLAVWADRDGTGRPLDSSTTFNLPNGAKRSPDAAWFSLEVLRKEGQANRKATKTRHVPAFLIEVTSQSDKLSDQQGKCREWVVNGVQEVILLHPETKTAFVFQTAADMITIPDAKRISSGVLKDFVLNCHPIWEDFF